MSDTSTQTPTPAAEPTPKPMTEATLVSLAHDYHVPMSEQAIKGIVGDAKEVSPEKAVAFEDYLKKTASGLFPTLATQIMAGIPTAYLLDPYRQVGKQILGDDFEPDFQTDPKMRAALTGATDPQTGRAVPMSLDAWQAHLKADPALGYMDSPKGQQEKADVMRQLNQAMQGGH